MSESSKARAKRGGTHAPFRILFVASEVEPFRKTGGLADVAGALPKALSRRGIDVRVVMPLYQGVPWRRLEQLDGLLRVPMYYGEGRAGVRMGLASDSRVPIYFVEHNSYFDRPHPYGPPGEAYPDNLERFAFFSRASLELCKALGFQPDVVHANDWQTALVPVYLNTVEWAQPLHASASVFTIHNLAHQGVFDGKAMFLTGLGSEHYHPGEFEHFGTLNLMKAAVQHGTMLSTVSPTYAKEIQSAAYGFGLDGVLGARNGDLRGILNGIDVDEWNPATDSHLVARYDAHDLAGKAECKAALQKEVGLPVRDDVALFGIVGRLTSQKGLDILAHALDSVLTWDLQMVLLGSGDPEAEHFFRETSRLQGDRFRATIGFNDGLAHRIEAGSDFFIMPSRFEPCGLNQMYSLRYGTLPIVRATGGLEDTVVQYDESTGEGTGFRFGDLDPRSLANTVGWALSTFYDRPAHIQAMRERAMAQDFSWDRAAADYERLYLDAYERRRGHPFVHGRPERE
jgi:starch synthase